MKTLSQMYRHAWHVGLKTTYYLRTLGASTTEKAIVGRRERAAVTTEETPDGARTCSIEAALNGGEC